MEENLPERLSVFVVNVLLLQRTIIYKSLEIQYVKEQLLEAALRCEKHFDSAGPSTLKVGNRKTIGACLEDMQTVHYWLRILREAQIGDSIQTNLLLEESLRIKENFAMLAKASGKRLIPSQSVAA